MCVHCSVHIYIHAVTTVTNHACIVCDPSVNRVFRSLPIFHAWTVFTSHIEAGFRKDYRDQTLGKINIDFKY